MTASADARIVRWTAKNPCPLCGEHQGTQRNIGKRCDGFTSPDGWLRCRRVESGRQDADGLYVHPPDPSRRPTPVDAPVRVGTDHQAVPYPLGEPEPTTATQTLALPSLGKLTRVDAARDAAGRILALQARYDGDGGKTYRPWTWCGPAAGWRHGANGIGAPWFGVEGLAVDDRPVLIVEGPKTRDRAASIFPDWCVLSPFHGKNSVARDVPNLAGRTVAMWPDADRDGGGLAAFRAAIPAIREAGARSVRLVNLPPELAALKDHWDLADEPPAGLDLHALLAAADDDQGDGEPPAGVDKKAARRSREKNAPDNIAAEEIAGELQNDLRYHFPTDTWYRYDAGAGVWRPTMPATAAGAIAAAIDRIGLAPNGYRAGYVASVQTLARRHIGIAEFSTRIAFTNGVLINGQLMPHAPERLLLHARPYAFDPDATCEPVIAWLTETMGGDKALVHILRCALNAIVNGRADIQVFFELLGPGGAGKGTFMRLCAALVGEAATVATELKRLEEIRFEPARLRDKLLIQVNDSDKYGGDVSMLKRLTGGDAIPFEEKGKQSGEDFRAAGVIVVTCNEPIRSSDYTSGLARRRVSIRFGRQVNMGEARDLEAEFRPYLPGVYAWANALDADQVARDLRNASRDVQAIAALREEIEHTTNPIAAWAIERLFYLSGARAKVGNAKRIPARAGAGPRGGDLMERDDAAPAYFLNADCHLYPSYMEWCEGSGVQAAGLNRFSDNLVDLLANQYKLPGVSKTRITGGVHINGVTLSGVICDLGKPTPMSEAREIQRLAMKAMKAMKTDAEAFIAVDPLPEPLYEGYEGYEDLFKSVPHTHMHAHTRAHTPGEAHSVEKPSQPSRPSYSRSTRGFEVNEGSGMEPSQPSSLDGAAPTDLPQQLVEDDYEVRL